ncbi:transcription initiation TFIID-like [Plasmodium gonderi]|uniref:Transcription initiation TFIID-like n=1 Tax=Plasmodium gonderi TaxID=77519 RepID=A0A1Y1JNY8_PLAGO|nr:transcription initiation TFIID-like [Plasmodium gonderi]GAW82947.1 transcription initiation TFIID-like [Plasmodium gonderi]
MAQPRKKLKLNNEQGENIFAQGESNMSVHNISMNAILCSSLNLDNIYKHFANCIYNPREFKCMRIDVPVSTRTINKYVNYIREKTGGRKIKMQVVECGDDDHMPSQGEATPTTAATAEATAEAKAEAKAEATAEAKAEATTTTTTPSSDPTRDTSQVEVTNLTRISTGREENNKSTTSVGVSSDGIVKTDNCSPSGYFTTKICNNIPISQSITEDNNHMNEKIIINVSIFSNGKIICTGNNSIEACKIAMKKIEKKLKQLNFKNIKLKNITITNILAVYNVGFSIVLPLFAQYYKSVDYDPNVFPACKVKIALTNENEKDTSEMSDQNEGNYAWNTTKSNAEKIRNKVDVVSASIFSTGNITLTGGKSYENLQKCIDILYPYLIKSKSQH